MNKRNLILAVLLILQLALVAIIFWPRPATTAAAGAALFPGLTADQINEVSLTDAQGQNLRLARKDSAWVLPDAGDYPAVTTTVTTLLDKIAGLKADRVITQTSASHKRLKVADDDLNTRIDLTLADGSQARLYVGSPAGYGAIHVRAGDQDAVYLASGLSSSDTSSQATAWIEPIYVAVPTGEVVAVTLENANGRLEFSKDASGAWTMAGLAPGETLDQGAVTSLVNSASSVSMRQPLGKEEKPEYGLQTPAAVVTLKTRGAEGEGSTTLRVGAQDAADQTYVLSSSGSPYYVRVSSYVVDDWIAKGRDSFLQAPPTAMPAP
jgi:hypothetical protein